MQKENSSNQIFLLWNILRECNFSCVYCVAKAAKGSVSPIDIGKVMERFNRLDKPLLIHITGGEPFLIPNFTELMEAVTKRNRIRLDTNLSLHEASRKFVETIDPDRVLEICFSTHVLEWEKRKNGLNQLFSNLEMFQRKGFKMIGNYVAYPPLMKRIQNDINVFKSYGIKVLPTFYWGNYNGKSYPIQGDRISYSNDEFELLKMLNPSITSHVFKTKGTYCQAGSSAFSINPEHEVKPCASIQKILGSFDDDWKTFDKVIKCPLKYCLCPVNRAPAVTLYPDDFPTNSLLSDAILEKGVYSQFRSYKYVLNFNPKHLLSSILDHFKSN